MVRALRSELAFSRLFAMSSLHVSSWLAAVGGSMRTGGGAFVRTDCAVASHRYQQDPRAQPPDQLGRSDAHARRRIGCVNFSWRQPPYTSALVVSSRLDGGHLRAPREIGQLA